jgi:hypothetical protein
VFVRVVRVCAAQALHGQQLVGRFVLQLDEAVNIGAAARERCARRARTHARPVLAHTRKRP